MKYRNTMMVVFAVAGCSDSGPQEFLPAAPKESAGGPLAAALVSDNLRPCGYDQIDDTPAQDGFGGSRVHQVARISYDARGLDVLEVSTSDDGLIMTRITTDYDAMGNPSHSRTDFGPGWSPPGTEEWQVYDSFGRLVRISVDDNLDGQEDFAYAAVWDSDGKRISSHRTSRRRGTSDRTYQYDPHGRLVRVDEDLGPDGVVDNTSLFQYDDQARTSTMTMTTRDGVVLETTTTRYDGANHVVALDDVTLTPADMTTSSSNDTFTYTGDRLDTQLSLSSESSPTLASPFTHTYRVDWHYDHCQ